MRLPSASVTPRRRASPTHSNAGRASPPGRIAGRSPTRHGATELPEGFLAKAKTKLCHGRASRHSPSDCTRSGKFTADLTGAYSELLILEKSVIRYTRAQSARRGPSAVPSPDRYRSDDPGDGLPQPKVINGTQQKPIEGVSMAYTFKEAQAKSPHTVRYTELIGNRGIYKDGWYALTMHQAPWKRGTGLTRSTRTNGSSTAPRMISIARLILPRNTPTS